MSNDNAMEVTVLDQPEQIAMLRLKTLHMAISIKLRTGMNMTRINPLPIARQDYGCKGRTAAKILEELETLYPFLKK